MTEPLNPAASLLCKLASIAVHADEMLSPGGHALDREALLSGLRDAEVVAWLSQMTASALAPVRRSQDGTAEPIVLAREESKP